MMKKFQPKTFHVRRGQLDNEIQGRPAAVREAKRLSHLGRGPVLVDRADGMVHMRFRNGVLEEMRRRTARR